MIQQATCHIQVFFGHFAYHWLTFCVNVADSSCFVLTLEQTAVLFLVSWVENGSVDLRRQGRRISGVSQRVDIMILVVDQICFVLFASALFSVLFEIQRHHVHVVVDPLTRSLLVVA